MQFQSCGRICSSSGFSRWRGITLTSFEWSKVMFASHSTLDCAQASIFLYFYLIVECVDRISRELDASTKGILDWLGGGVQEK